MKQVAEPRPSWSASAVKYLQNLQNRHSSTGVPVLFFEMFITRNAGAGSKSLAPAPAKKISIKTAI